MPDLIIVTGVPGTGKTTVSKMLSERINGTHIDLSELVKEKGLYSERDEERQTLIVDIEKLGHQIKHMTSTAENTIILDGHIAPQVAPGELVSKAFVLRRAPWDLEKVLEARGWPPEKVKENVEAELIDIALIDTLEYIDEEKTCEINITGKKPEETIREILQVLEGSKPCKIGIVDWLDMDKARRLIR